MPDITQPDTLPTVQRRHDGQPKGGGKDLPARDQPSKMVAAYQEVARTKPIDDRITILGIPVEQITPVTQAALAGLVAEINHLRNIVKRHERGADKRAAAASGGPDAGHRAHGSGLEPEAFLRALAATLEQPVGEGNTWAVVLVHVATYEDIRRSSGLLAANSAMADVAQRLKDMRVNLAPDRTLSAAPSDLAPVGAPSSFVAVGGASISLAVVGYAGGSNLAGVAALPTSAAATDAVAKAVRLQLSAGGYAVGGIDMALAISVAVAAAGDGESALLALGRADHLLRTSP